MVVATTAPLARLPCHFLQLSEGTGELCSSGLCALLVGRRGAHELSWQDVDDAAAGFSAPASAEPRLASAAQPPRPVPRVRPRLTLHAGAPGAMGVSVRAVRLALTTCAPHSVPRVRCGALRVQGRDRVRWAFAEPRLASAAQPPRPVPRVRPPHPRPHSTPALMRTITMGANDKSRCRNWAWVLRKSVELTASGFGCS